MLIITQAEVERLLPMRECIPLMEQALASLARGEVVLPLRTVVRVPDQRNVLAVMPAVMTAPAAMGAKIITVFPGNHGTPRDSHQGAVMLFDPQTGSIEALLDATAITAVRTAAVSAVATKHLARHDADDLAVLGSGVQAARHIEAIAAVRSLRRVRVWSRNPENAARLAADAERLCSVRAEPVGQAEDAVREASIVCTCTSAREPVLRGEWIAMGAHVNAVGASTPDGRELDTAAVVRSRVFADRRESALNEPGDILVPLREQAIGPEHVVGELGEVIAGLVSGRHGVNDITLFKSLGLAIEDIAAAQHVVAQARATGAGIEVDLGGRREAARGSD